MNKEILARKVDSLQRQCEKCMLGKKPIGPKSGCEVRKKLVSDQSEIAWKHEHLFLENGKCKMAKQKR